LEDIIEEEIKKAIRSKDCGPKDYLVLVKMLCAKKGMKLDVWQEMVVLPDPVFMWLYLYPAEYCSCCTASPTSEF
jgi:hypothetical protein